MGLFRKWLCEVRKEDIDRSTPQEDPPFDSIFGNKFRIVVPLGKDEEMEFLEFMRGNGYDVDFSKGIVSYKAETQRGTVIRQERIGKAIRKLARNDSTAEKWAHWWEKSKDKIQQLIKSDAGVSIVVSRHPIDVLRMSDHKEWRSCHSPSNPTYFPCAMSEARNGGVIAYVVRNEDLKDVDLQSNEVFEDRDRGIEGFRPLERLRFRRLSHQEGGNAGEPEDLLVPERRTYGTKHSGFLDTMMKWAMRSQGLDPKNPPDYDNYDLRGGSYKDNDINDLWNDFFGLEGDDAVWDDKESVDMQEEEEDLEEQVRATFAHHQESWDHVGGDVELEDYDGQPYIWAHIGIGVSFPDNIFNKIPTEEDLSGWGNDLLDDIKDSIYSSGVSSVNLGEIRPWHDENKKEIHIWIEFAGDDDNSPIFSDLDDFESFLDDVDRADMSYDGFKDGVYKGFIQNGWIKDWRNKTVDNHHQFQHFEVLKDFDEEDPKESYPFAVISDPIWFGNLMGLSQDAVLMGSFVREHPKVGNVATVVFNQHTIKGTIKEAFPDAITEYNLIFIGHSKTGSHTVSQRNETGVYQKPINLGVYLHVTFEGWNDTAKKYPAMIQMDQNWDYLQKRVFDVWKRVEPYLKPNPEKNWGYHKQPPFEPPEPKVNNNQAELPFEWWFRRDFDLKFREFVFNEKF